MPDTPTSAHESVLLAVDGGRVHVHVGDGASQPAELSWPADLVRVRLFGEPVEGASCRVPAGATLEVEAVQLAPETTYIVGVSRDRMEATLCMVPEEGARRNLVDAEPSPRLHLALHTERLDAPEPDMSVARQELQRAGVTYGVRDELVEAALDAPHQQHVVAHGLDPVEGRNGAFERLVDFQELRATGVLADTPLVRRIRKVEGTPGCDVTGRELRVKATHDVRIKGGDGVRVDEQGILAVASVDGAPHMDSDGFVEVRHELVVEDVDAITGDIVFHGSVRVLGSVHEGRRLVARDQIFVAGNVDRATIESGGTIEIEGSIMSSVLRAGGERAVAATIADRVLDLPRTLGLVAAQARQFRDQADARETSISHGLSIQLVLERIQRSVLPALASVVEDLREAGPSQADAVDRVAAWHRALSTAANVALTPEQFSDILVEASALAEDVQRAIEQPADLHVRYMQACEAESTGTVTIVGKGIFNSRIVAWGGLVSQQFEAVLRGGSVVSHGPVQVREVGSPAGVRTSVQLGTSGSLESDRVYAGTVVQGPGYTHRFVADRAHVRIAFDTGGSMNVESLAA